MNFIKPFLLFVFATVLLACNNPTDGSQKSDTATAAASTTDTSSLKEEAVSYAAGGTTMNGYVVYDSARQGRRPIVLVVPEWWGLNEYPRRRARMLAQLGYVAMAVDLFGGGKIAADPKQAQELTAPFNKDPQLAKARLDAALAKAKSLAQADTAQVAAIGYCFGGSMVLNYAKLGGHVAGVVSFHGVLDGVPPPKGMKTKVLVCHGGADTFTPPQQVAAFRKSMDSAGVDYTFKVYPGATHAFTNPAATQTGEKFNMPIRYNAAADTASWNDMKAFFGRLFHE